MDGVVKEVPVPNDEPPVDAAYQLIVPAEAVAPNVTVPVPQREPGVVPVMVGMVLTVMVTIFEVAGLPVVQVAFEVSTQVTASVFTGV
jgi:hypothetical protein